MTRVINGDFLRAAHCTFCMAYVRKFKNVREVSELTSGKYDAEPILPLSILVLVLSGFVRFTGFACDQRFVQKNSFKLASTSFGKIFIDN